MTDALRDRLIEAGRILEFAGQADFILGHVTARHPDRPDEILMKPMTIGLEEMTPENIITINLEGEKTSGQWPRHAEVFIHSELMRARPDINAVVHTHAPHAVVFSSLNKTLVPVGHDGALFADGLPVFDETTDLIVTQQLGRSVARSIADRNALLLRNHGIVTAGRTIEEAIFLALRLENACKMQLMAEACGGPKLVTPREEALAKKKRWGGQEHTFNYLARRSLCQCRGCSA